MHFYPDWSTSPLIFNGELYSNGNVLLSSVEDSCHWSDEVCIVSHQFVTSINKTIDNHALNEKYWYLKIQKDCIALFYV